MLFAFFALISSARAQFSYSEDFKNSTAPGWVLNPAGNSNPGPILTSGATARTGDYASGTIDPSGSGWLRLTNDNLNLANAVYFDTPIPSAGNSVTIAFGANFWGGNNYNNTGADGITFFLYDASKPFAVGSSGGAIGYAQGAGVNVNGLNGGFVGVAFDPYGNFSTTTEGRQGGTATLQPNSVAVRGPGTGTTGYNYLAGTGNFDFTDTGVATVKDATDGAVPALPYTMAFPTATTRPNQSTQYRNISITLNESSQLLVSMQFGEDGLWYQLLNVDLSSFVRPEQLKMGFTAGTGSGTLVTEIGGLLTIQATAGTGNFIWDNRNGPSDSGVGSSVWGTGANDPLNWAGQTNPTLKSNVIFNSTYISSTQNINVNGSDKVLTNLYFSGANSYNLSTSESRKLIFDSNTVSGLTAINLTNDAGGNAAHTIGLDVQMNKNLDINNNITPTFTITGNIDTGGNVLGLKGTGTTVLSGAISGAGSLAKSDSGTTRLTGSGANTYTGNTTIAAGTLQIEKATALGSTAAGTVVSSGGTLALAGSGTTFAAEGLTINGTGVASAGALRNVAGANTWTGTVALGAAGTNSIGVDSGSLNISGVVSGAAGNNLSKVGNGTLTLSGVNTYSGNTTINAGTIAIAADSALGSAPGVATTGNLNLDGGTLQNTAVMTLNATRGIALGTAGGTIQTDANLTYNGIAAGGAGTGSLNKTGTATLILGGTNTYTGGTNINQGTLQLGASNVLGDSTAVTVASGATFSVNSQTDTVGSLAGAGAVTLGTGALTVGANNSSTTFSGTVSGSGSNSVTKTGNGTMTLAGAANSFAPATLNVNQGTVQLGVINAVNTATVLALNGGTFAVGTSGNTTLSRLNLLNSSTLDFLSNTSTLTFTDIARTTGTLTIANWSGNPFGAGDSQLKSTNLPTGFTATGTSQYDQISFVGYPTGAVRLATGEIVPNTGGTVYTTTGTGTVTWGTNSQWTPTGVPSVVGDTAILGSSITTPTTVNLGANRTIGYLTIDNTQTTTVSTGFNLTFDVTGTGTSSGQLIKNNSGNATISAPIILNNDALNITRNDTGNLGITSTITNAGNTITLTDNSLTGSTSLTGIISGTGGVTKNGIGTATLTGINTFTGKTIINAGVLEINAETGLGGNPGAITADQLTINGGSLRTITNPVTIDDSRRGITIGANGGTIDTVTDLIVGQSGTTRNLITMTGTLTKTGSGTLSLLGNAVNAGNGAVNITGGALSLEKSSLVSAIGDTAAVTVGTGASLKFNAGNSAYNSETVGSIAGSGTIDNVQATTAFTLVTGGDNTNTTFSGTIQDTGASLALTKSGTGTLTLSGTNTYVGATSVSAGAINIQSNTALGDIAAGTSVTSGAALELQNNITVTGEALTLNGTGVTASPNGALRNVSGNNTWTGVVTLGSPTTITSDAGQLTLTGATVSAAAQGLTFNGSGNTSLTGVFGNTTGNTGALASTLTKQGNGTLTLSGVNTYTGATTVSGGTLEIQSASALGSTAGTTTVANGATLALSGGITSAEPLTINGQGVAGAGAIRNLSGNNTLSGTIALGTASYVGVAAATTLTTTGIISGTTDLTKVGDGTLVLNGTANNSYSGTTAVNAGTLEFRQAGQLGAGVGVTTVASGATLRVNGSGLNVTENVTLGGTGVGSLGALQNAGGNNTWSGNLTMTSNSIVGVSAGTTLSQGGSSSIASSGGAFDLIKTDAGTLALSGVNTYSGSTIVRDGTLSVNSNSPVSGNGALGNSGSTVQIGDSGTAVGNNLGLVLGNATGGVTLDRPISVNNFNTSGTVTLGGTNTSGTNTLTGNIGLGKDTILTSSGGTVAFTGDLSGPGALTASGNGTIVLSGNNSLTGAATVNSGATLVAASNNALGGTTAGTTVNTGGTLGLQGGISIPAAESLTIAGTGVGSAGALNNVSGTNAVTGNITLSANSNIGASAGNLSLSGVITGTGNSLTKVGAGEVSLSGTSANTYTGGTTVSAGTLTLNKTPGLDATGPSGTITVTGGTLALGNDNQINNSITLALSGGTFLTNNNSDTIGSLSLLGNSTINFSNGDSSILSFTNAARTAGTLTVADWNGIPTVGGGGSQLVFSNAGTGFGATDISFTGFGGGWTRLPSGEIVPVVAGGNTYTWNSAAGTTWATGTNWTPNTTTWAANDTAVFANGTITGNRTIDTGASRTLGYLAFNGSAANNYTISNNTLNLSVTNGNAQIQVDDAAAPTINSAIAIANTSTGGLNISSSSSGTLTVNGAITGNSATARPITVNGSGTVVLNGALGGGSGGISDLTKGGSSTLVISNVANTYTGDTTVNNGTLQLNASANSGSGSLGTSTNAIVLGSASSPSNAAISLLTNGAGVNVARNITVSNNGTSTTLGGLNTTGTSTYSGAVTLGKSVTLTAATGGEVAFTGVLSGTGGITKTGDGTVTLGGTASNTFTGNVDIQSGTLKLNANGGYDVLGATQGVIGDLASVTLSGATAVLTVGGPVGQTLEEIGSLSGVAGSNVNVTQTTPFTLYTGNNNNTTTFAGTLTNSVGANFSLVKQGTGTMTLTGANSYDGTTTVSAGTLVAANNTALGTATGNTTVAGNATLGLQGGITIAAEQLNLTAITSPNIASLANLSGNNTYGGNITMTGATANDQVKFDAAGISTLTITGSIGEATNAKVLTKTGSGTIVLSGANTYTGSTNVAVGTLVVANNAALGTTAAGTAVQIGATLGIQNNVTVAAGETYTLNGTTNPPGAPSLKNISGTNTLGGNITLSGGINTGVAIDSSAGSLTLNGTIAQTSNPNFVIKTGSGDLILGGTTANTFSGGFTINDGKVIAAKTAGFDATGAAAVNIGDGLGTTASATLQLNASNQINNASNVTISTDGKLDLQANSDTIGALTMSGGSVTATGAGTLTLGGNLTFTGVGTNTASITSNLDLGIAGTRIIQVGNNGVSGDNSVNANNGNVVPAANYAGDKDLVINGVISGTGSSFNKTDLGVLELTGTTSNTFNGSFQVSDGTVLLNKTSGQNATGAGNSVTVGDGIGGAKTAILKLANSNQIVDSATVTVNSDGQFNLNGLTETIGAIAGTGNIETGAGILTIKGTSVFGGTLTDATGTIVAENNIPGFNNGFVSSVGSGRVIFDAPGGSLTFTSNIAYAGTLELKNGTFVMPGVNFTVGTLEITGNTILDFGNSAASILNATNIRLAAGATLTINNWVNNVDFFFAQNWLAGTTVPTINTRGVGDETQITFTGFSNTQTAWLDYNNASKHQITPAPEPSTYGAIFIGAAFAFLGYRRWRNRRPVSITRA